MTHKQIRTTTAGLEATSMKTILMEVEYFHMKIQFQRQISLVSILIGYSDGGVGGVVLLPSQYATCRGESCAIVLYVNGT